MFLWYVLILKFVCANHRCWILLCCSACSAAVCLYYKDYEWILCGQSRETTQSNNGYYYHPRKAYKSMITKLKTACCSTAVHRQPQALRGPAGQAELLRGGHLRCEPGPGGQGVRHAAAVPHLRPAGLVWLSAHRLIIAVETASVCLFVLSQSTRSTLFDICNGWAGRPYWSVVASRPILVLLLWDFLKTFFFFFAMLRLFLFISVASLLFYDSFISAGFLIFFIKIIFIRCFSLYLYTHFLKLYVP